jgi:hypothetical protein
MSIQLWSSKGQHFFVDRALGGVQVGQTWEENGGQWKVEVNDDYVAAKDLKDAIRIFMHLYRRRYVQLSPASCGEGPSARGFRIRWIGDAIDDEPPKRHRAKRKLTTRSGEKSDVKSKKDRLFSDLLKVKWPMAPDPAFEPLKPRKRARRKSG